MCVQWSLNGDPTPPTTQVRDELADVMTYYLYLAMTMDLAPEEIVMDKLEVTGEKYPVDKAYGRSGKYDRL